MTLASPPKFFEKGDYHGQIGGHVGHLSDFDGDNLDISDFQPVWRGVLVCREAFVGVSREL